MTQADGTFKLKGEIFCVVHMFLDKLVLGRTAVCSLDVPVFAQLCTIWPFENDVDLFI